MEPVSTLKTAGAAVSLVSALAKLIKEAKAKPDETGQVSLRDLLSRLHIDALRLSRDLENRLRALVERSHDYGLNPALSLEQHLQNLNWYNVLTRSRLKSFREECHSIYRQLTGFMDDATALLLCRQDQQVASSAFLASLDVKRQIDALYINPDLPIGKLLDGLLATASRVSSELQGA
jgi:hypothetical protein